VVSEDATVRIDGGRHTYEVDRDLNLHLILQVDLQEIDMKNLIGDGVSLNVPDEGGTYFTVQLEIDNLCSSMRAHELAQIFGRDLHGHGFHGVSVDIRRHHAAPPKGADFLAERFAPGNVQYGFGTLGHGRSPEDCQFSVSNAEQGVKRSRPVQFDADP
jgi:hypothetical protein